MTWCCSSTESIFMKSRSPKHRRSGFTLLELLVVLVILAAVTSLAFRSLDKVQDQQRYDASRTLLKELDQAVLGDEETAGFVSDMGRLPQTVLQGGELTLAELWQLGSLPAYDVRSHALDPEVLVPTGWRGPYLTLPLDAANVYDGWGNPMRSLSDASPANPNTTGYHRLRDENDAAIISAGQPISIIRHLGANGEYMPTDAGTARDLSLSFVNRFEARLKATVQVLESDDSPAAVSLTDQVYVRVFTPNPTDVTQLLAVADKTAQAPTVSVPAASGDYLTGLTIGARAIRAYVIQDQGNGDPADDVLIAKSPIKHVTLRPGVNFISLTIYRP